MNQATLKRLELADKRTAVVAAAPAALDGAAALLRLGVSLDKLTNDELARLEVLAGAWPDDGTVVPAAAIWACLGRG